MESMSSQPSRLRPADDSGLFGLLSRPAEPVVGVKAGWVKKYL